MKTLLSRWLCIGLAVVAVLALISSGCGGGGGGGGEKEAIKPRILTGTVFAPVSPPANLLSAVAGSPVANAKVWLEGYIDIPPQYTDASGTYTFVGVPAAEHFVVASFNQYGSVYKQRVRVLIQATDVDITAPSLSLEEASVILTGILKDSTGKALPAGTEMRLWGEVFTVGRDGSFTTPVLPASLNQAELFVKLPGATAFTSFHGPFIAGSTPAFIEQTVLLPDSGNHAPSGVLIAKNTAGIATVKCVTSEQLNLSLTPYDPDTGHRERLSYTWTASRGTLQVTGNQTTATWLAMDSYGLATISVAITDPEGVSAKVSLRILVNIQSMDETDTISPTVVSRTPAANTVGVTPESSVSIVFSEELLASSVPSGAIAVVGQNSAVSGVATLQADKKTVIWSPSPSLPGNQTITVSLAPTISDLYGNQLGEQNSWTFTTALVPNVTVNSLHTNDTTPEISGTVDDPNATVQVTINSITYSAIIDGTSWKVQLTTALADGIYDIKAVATNKSGVPGSDGTSNELTIDTGPKTAVLSGLPTVVTSSDQTSIIVGGTGVVSYLYRHRRLGDVWPAWSPPASVSVKIELPGLVDGIYTLQVRAIDVAGNTQSEGNATAYEWQIDTTVKTAQLDVNTLPLNPTNQTTANITVGGDSVAFYRFRLNTGSWSVTYPVATPISLVGLKSGTNVISVLGGDSYGNWQSIESPTAFTWVIDAAVKVAVLSNKPLNPTNDNSASIIVGGEGVTKYKYSTDGGTTWSAEILISVDDRITMNALADGVYSVKVVGGDNLATWQSTANATTWAWTVDTVAPTVVLSTTVFSPTNLTPIPVRIEFSEPVKDFAVGKITVTNGTAASLQPIVSGKTWVVNISPSNNGVVTVDIAGAAVTDAAGNDNTAADQLSFERDSANPTATLLQVGGDPINSSPIVVSVTFSKPVSGFALADLLVGNGSASNLQVILASTTWSVDITPAGQGEVTVDLAANKAVDDAGNGNDVSNHLSFTYDSIRPTVALSTTAPDPTSVAPIPVVITFSEEVNNFILSDIVVGNGNAGNLQVVTAGTAWSVDITPGQGEITVDIAANVAVDNANNSNTAAAQLKIGYDSIPPVPVLATTAGAMTNVSPIPFTIDFGENVQSFLLSHLTITNGTASNLQVDTVGRSWKFDVVPGSAGNVSVSLVADKVFDPAGNGNTAVAPVVVNYDSNRPSATLSTSTGLSFNTAPITVFVEFGKDVIGFDTSLLVIMNGSSGGLTPITPSRKWSFVVTPLAQGVVTINLPSNKVFDNAGNSNTAANQVRVVYDSVSPTVVFTSTASATTNLSPIPITVSFNEAVVGFDINDITVTNGTAGSLQPVTTDRVWTFPITPSGQGVVSVDMGADVATDAAGNGNAPATQLSRVYDTAPPIAQITTARPSPTNLSPIPITVSFTKDVTSFALTDLTVTNGTAGDLLVAVPNRAWTVNIFPTADGIVSIDLPAGIISDIAGNTNPAAVPLSIEYETSRPTAVISSTITGLTNASPFLVTVTFDKDVSAFVAGDLTVINGMPQNEAIISSNRVWTVEILPYADGQVDIDLAADRVVDMAGNGNTAANQLTIDYDGTNPTVALSTTAVSPTNVSPIPVTIEFNEVVTGFDLSDLAGLAVTNGVAQNLQAVPGGKIWTVDIFPSSDNTVVQINLAAGAATDAAENGNAAASLPAVTFISEQPTVTITSGATSPTSSNPIPIIVTFGKAVTGFAEGDLVIGNGSVFPGSLATLDNIVWTVNITPANNGVVTVNVPANVAVAVGDNWNTAAALFSITYDSVRPTVALSTTSPNPTRNNVIPVAITFDKNVTDFDLGDLTLVNGTTDNLQVLTAGRSWTFNLTVSGEGASSVTLAANAVHDAANNGNTAGNIVSVVYDSIDPTATLATTAPEPTSSSIPVTVTFSEPVSDFKLIHLTVSNGSASNLQVVTAGEVWSFTVTPAGNGQVRVNLAANRVVDAAGNGNTAAVELSRTYDVSNPGVTLTTAVTSPTNISPIPVTITFTEDVTGFVVGDLIPGNCTTSGFAGSGQNYSVNITPTGDGTVSVNLPAGRALDSAGNGNTAATQLSLVYDTALPTVALTTATTSPTNASSFLVTITFNENVTGFEETDISVSNGSVNPGSLQVVSAGRVWRMYIAPGVDGPVVVSLPADSAQDAAGNGNVAASQLSITYDMTKPTAVITTAVGSPTGTSPIPMIITFAEPVNGFVLSNLSVANGSVTNLAVETTGLVWSFNLTPSTSGAVTVDLPANKLKDVAGNWNEAAPQFSIVYDNVRPAVTLATATPGLTSPTNVSPIPVTITFTEDVTGFVVGDLVPVNCTLNGFAGSGRDYSVNIVPTPGANVAVALDLPANVANDSADNGNTAANQLSLVYDNVRPTVTLATYTEGITSPTNISPIRVRITFSEAVSTLELGDLTVGNGAAGNLVSELNQIWRVDIVPTATGPVTVDLGDGVVTDAAGNTNIAAAQLSIIYDSERPSVSFTSSAPSPTNTSPIPFTITFSKLVNGFNLGMLSVGNGTAGNLSATVARREYTFDVTPGSNGNVTVDMAEGQVYDDVTPNGNYNTAAAQIVRIYDNSPPVVELTTASSTVGGAFDVTVTFNEPVTGLTAGDFTVVSATAGVLTEITPTVWTLNILNLTGSPVTVQLPADSVNDLVGNGNIVSNELSVIYDNVRPTVTLSSTAPDPTNSSPIPLTITFDEQVTGFTADDLILGNATLSIGIFESSPRKMWTTNLLPFGDGLVTVNINANVAKDAAGNDNTAAVELTRLYDATRPGVTFSSDDAPRTNANPITFRVTFTELIATTTFALDDIIVSGGTLGALTTVVEGLIYDFTVTPSADGTVTVSMVENMVKDIAGNFNLVATSASVVYDTVQPAVILTSDKVWTNGAFRVTVTFDDEIDPATINFGDLVFGAPANCSLVNFQPDATGRIWTVDLTATADPITVKINAGAVQDLAGNDNTESNEITVRYDNGNPGVTLTSAAPDPTNVSPIVVTVTFTEAVIGFTADDMALVNATVGGITPVVANTSWNVSVIPDNPGPITVEVGLKADAVTDTAGNFNAPVAPITRDYDAVRPTVLSVSGSNGTFTVGSEVTIVVTFSENIVVTGAPTLVLNTGKTPFPSATYASDDGGDRVTFTYTVKIGDFSSDLEYSTVNALQLSGGSTIRDGAGNNVILTLPALGDPDSLSGTSNIVVDAVGPRVVSMTSSPTGLTYTTGSINIQVEFDENVDVQGVLNSSTLLLNVNNANPGGVVASATYLSGAGSKFINYRYIVKPGDSTQPNFLNYTATNALKPNSSVFRDGFGNVSTYLLPPTGSDVALSQSLIIIVNP